MSFEVTDKRTIDRRTWDEKSSKEILQDIREAQEWSLPWPKVEPAKPTIAIKILPETLRLCALTLANRWMSDQIDKRNLARQAEAPKS